MKDEQRRKIDDDKDMDRREKAKDLSQLAWATLSAIGIYHVVYVHPIELMKVRMQMNPTNKIGLRPNTISIAYSILNNDGIIGFYNGISASIAKTVLYTGTRFFLYNYLIRMISEHIDNRLTSGEKMTVGFCTGGIAAFLSTPARFAFVRMAADAALPIVEQRHYGNVFAAIYGIAQEEGVGTLWRGAAPTIYRSMVINSFQLSFYSEIKNFLKNNFESLHEKSDRYHLQLYSSLISTFLLTTLVAPIDITITRLQLMNMLYHTQRPYLNTFDCMFKIVHQEGFFALWKGFTPLFIKLMPSTLIALFFLHNFDEYCYEF